MVLLLHHPKAYNPDNRPGEADSYVAKHRNGHIGTVHLTFQGVLSCSVDAARVDPGSIPPQKEY